MKKLILVLLLLNTFNCVYEDQFGIFEWVKENFGSVDHIYKNGPRFFVSDETSFGVINSKGEHAHSRQIDYIDLQIDLENNQRTLYLNHKQNTIELYNPWNNTLERI